MAGVSISGGGAGLSGLRFITSTTSISMTAKLKFLNLSPLEEFGWQMIGNFEGK